MQIRIIKFRFWDTQLFKMIDGDMMFINDYSDSGRASLQTTIDGLKDRYETMQFTGLKDKNGKEIYEGDIVKFHDHPTGVEDGIGEVYWQDGKWKVTWSMIDLGDFGTAWTEVVGNIYENSELITPSR